MCSYFCATGIYASGIYLHFVHFLLAPNQAANFSQNPIYTVRVGAEQALLNRTKLFLN